MAERPPDPDLDRDFAHANGWDRQFETYDDFDLPTYVGPATFMNLPWVTDPAELRRREVDVAIIGAPFDDAVTHRPGARFGPRAIREAQYTSGSINSLQLDVEPFEVLTVVDAGDANIVPAWIERGPRADLPQGPRGRQHRRDPDRARWRPLDHLAERHRDRRGPPPGQHRDRPFRCPRRHRRATTGASWPATARRCGGSSSPARSRARTSSRSACAATGRRSRRSTGCASRACATTSCARSRSAARRRSSPTRSTRRSTARTAIYLCLDIDVIDPGMAPGTGTPEPGGMLTREVLRAIRQIVGRGRPGRHGHRRGLAAVRPGRDDRHGRQPGRPRGDQRAGRPAGRRQARPLGGLTIPADRFPTSHGTPTGAS